MNLVWVIDPVTKEEFALNLFFESIHDAFQYKEKMAKKYPDLIFYHTTGINVDPSEMKELSEIV